MSNKIELTNVREVLSTLKTDCFKMYVDVLSQVQDLITFNAPDELTESEAAHIINTLSMIRADLRTLSKAEI